MTQSNRLQRSVWMICVFALAHNTHSAWASESHLHQQVQRVALSFLNRDWNVQLSEVSHSDGRTKGPWTYVRSQSETQWIWIQADRGPLEFEPNFRALDRLLDEILESKGGVILLTPSPYEKQIRENSNFLSKALLDRFRILVPFIHNDGAGVIEIVRHSGRYRTQRMTILPNFIEALRFGILSEYKASHNLSSLWITSPQSISLHAKIQGSSPVQFTGDFFLSYATFENEKGQSGLRERTILQMIRKWLRNHYSVWRDLDSSNIQFSNPQEMLRLEELESAVDPMHESRMDGVLIGEIVRLRIYQRMGSLFDKLYTLLEERVKLDPKRSIRESFFPKGRLPVLHPERLQEIDLENLYIFSDQLRRLASPRLSHLSESLQKGKDSIIPAELLLWAYDEIHEDIENLWRNYEEFFGDNVGIEAPMFKYSNLEGRERAKRNLFRDTLLRILRARVGKKKPLEQNALYRSAKDFDFDPLAPHKFPRNTAITMMDLRILWILQEILDGVSNLKMALIEDSLLEGDPVEGFNPYALSEWGFQISMKALDRVPLILSRDRLLPSDQLRGREVRSFLRR